MLIKQVVGELRYIFFDKFDNSLKCKIYFITWLYTKVKTI